MSMLIFFAPIMLSSSLVHAKILVVSPHPDDDVITSAGIIYSALKRGEEVRIIYMTNGDYSGVASGYTRQIEAVTGQAILGVAETHLIFLGYPDGSLSHLVVNCPTAGDICAGQSGAAATYGNRGLGRVDYHKYRFCVSASYNRANILMDLEDIIASFRPEHIFVTSEHDKHPDHAVTYQLIRQAVISVNRAVPAYTPVLHKTTVHFNYAGWPPGLNPAAPYAAPPDLSAANLVWADRECIDVPLVMQSTDYYSNPKYRAIEAHATQGGSRGYLGRFLRKDEFFWPENVFGTNHPPIVYAGIDQLVPEGALVTLNGSQSRDLDGDTLTYQWVQRSGISVQLSDAASPTPYFTAPAGLSRNEILTFELVVSDGKLSSMSDSVNINVRAGLGKLDKDISDKASLK
jgi:LmbE family N-acetylglucosaminyl deacetylase